MTPSASPSREPSPAREGGYDPRFNQELFAAEDHHFWFRSRNRIVAAMAAKYTSQLPAGFYVLEVGCGNGSVTRVLQDTCATGNVIGADLYLEGLVNARSRGVKMLVQADIAVPTDSGFALAGMFDVLEHIPDDCGALRSLYNALSPGGRLLLSVPAHQSLWASTSTKLRSITAGVARRLARRSNVMPARSRIRHRVHGFSLSTDENAAAMERFYAQENRQES